MLYFEVRRILGQEGQMKILLPVDGSAASLRAVRFAIRLAGAGLDTRVVLANVQEPSTLYELVVAHDPNVIEQVSAAAGAHILETAQGLLTEANIVFESEVASGDPAHTIIDIVERFGCDMVVMGASGSGALRSALLGSVSSAVLNSASVPVLIVKAADEYSDNFVKDLPDDQIDASPDA
jgi:nucleotide-binding universal stress UspA family protein